MSRAPGRGPARFPQPILDARLGDGSRVAICVPPASPHVDITVRRFGTRSFSATQLIAQGALPAHIRDEAERVLHTRRNILVSGRTASGNTTLLNVLIALIPDDQRIVAIEDTLELRIDSPNCVRFEARRLQQGALTDPFTKLASVPTRFIGLGLSWKNDFTGIPRGIASSVENMGESGKSFRESWEQRLTDADTVSETDILNLFQDSSPEGAERASRAYLAAREGSDNRLVLDHATSTVATNLIVAAKDAVDSYERLRENINTSNTALAQSQVTGAVTQGHLTAAMAQLMAFQAAKEAAEGYESEITRREALAARVRKQQRADLTYNAHLAGIVASRARIRDGMLFSIPPLYGGTD